MLDALSAITAAVHRNLSDKLYEKRKNAALELIVPPVINSFSDQDSRVRYCACEGLYNIAKATSEGRLLKLLFSTIYEYLQAVEASNEDGEGSGTDDVFAIGDITDV